ncbi:Yip1 family protein [Motilimonas pumila]|uniref:YIP1 family protein n=1 Tax=Motilimonas pumila TaxID=2303987 RepID=A0A418YEV8_9GAMM|nr:Yip1 family protein [Motilimonas pumila]RJG47693.1 YIP1 family protein [Motilimonas pumila]
MVLNHIWGLYTHPKSEWHTIDRSHENISMSISHILLIALVPSVCMFYSTVFTGWSIGAGDPIYLSMESAAAMSVATYFALVMGVFALAYLANWMSLTFGAEHNYTHSLELAAYTATPLFMVGFAALYPSPWFIMMVGFVGLAWSIYLLYTGVPILMHIPEDQGFIYASSVVTVGLVLLVAILASSVILWSIGFGPSFV